MPTEPRRIKAIIKQVIGSPFTDAAECEKERDFIKQVVKASKTFWDPGIPRPERQRLLDCLLDELIHPLQHMLHDRLAWYIEDLAEKLTDRKFKIKWSKRKNNCQVFCDNLISVQKFGALFPRSKGPQAQTRPYLISFVCRPNAYRKPAIRTKYDVPNGLTEEYLLKFRWGIHEELDIIDRLLAYWYDWGAFGGPIYPFQDLFPWDCSQAFRSDTTKCSDCNIFKHVWAFPFDSWSIISLHLFRNRCLYSSEMLSDEAWMRNRLILLKAEDALTSVARAMAKNEDFQRSTEWLHIQDNPYLDRVKLGGIHRAQPWSRFINRGVYNDFLVAPWAHLRRDDQIKQYEAQRDLRMELVEVGVPSRVDTDKDMERGMILPLNTILGPVQALIDSSNFVTVSPGRERASSSSGVEVVGQDQVVKTDI